MTRHLALAAAVALNPPAYQLLDGGRLAPDAALRLAAL